MRAKQIGEFLGVSNEPVKPTWSKLLDDPRWDALRAQTICLHPFCKSCRQRNVVLNVHHPVYDGRKPWEYKTTELVVLCRSCHEGIHQAFNVARSVLSNMNATDAKVIVGLLLESNRTKGPGFAIRTLANALR